MGGKAYKLAAYYALATATGLAITWTATWADVLPGDFVPRQLAASHVAAELATAALLILGAVLTLRAHRAHWTLATGLGALAYATLNVMGDFADRSVMLAVLGMTLILTLVALVAAFRQSGTTRDGDSR